MMTGLSWMLLTTALLLLAGDSESAVDQNLLATIINKIWTDYNPKRMFSIAVSIPQTSNNYDVNNVLNEANGAEVRDTFKSGGVYTKGRIVAAKVQIKKGKTGEDIHAEYRVLQNFDSLFSNHNNFENDLLIFYVLGSPCYHKCTNPNNPSNILQYLQKIKKWKNYAFVFTHISKSKNKALETSEEDLRTALGNLGNTGGLGLKNIFRCKETNNVMECNSCSQNNQIAQYCISNEPDDNPDQPGSSRGRDNSPSQSIKGRDNSPSQSIKGRDNSPSQTNRGRDNSPSQSIRGRDRSPSQRDPFINRNNPAVSTGSNQGDSLVRRLCLSCVGCCDRRRSPSDK